MADMGASSSNAEQTDNENNEKSEEYCEPEIKKRKINKSSADRKLDKLEHRLGGILCCAVCLDLPKAAIYQCTNGHLMCAGCFTHVLADARLRDEMATCPNCRIEISKSTASRNLAVEKAVSELPAECQYCNKEFPRNSLERHEETSCDERITSCCYSRIGCPWRGPFHEAMEHEGACTHPHRTGAEVMEALQVIDEKSKEEKKLYDSVFDLLSYEKIIFSDLQLKPYRSDEFVHKLFYETPRFPAFNNQWVVKARINNSQKDPTLSSERKMKYQVLHRRCSLAGRICVVSGDSVPAASINMVEDEMLKIVEGWVAPATDDVQKSPVIQELILKTKTTVPLNVHYLILRGPFGDMKVNAKIYKFDFTDQDNESPYVTLPLIDTAECNRLLAAKAINFRLIMFLVAK